MDRWVGVVQHSEYDNKRVGETIINLGNVDYICVVTNMIYFCGGDYIKVNDASIKHLLDVLETE